MLLKNHQKAMALINNVIAFFYGKILSIVNYTLLIGAYFCISALIP